MAKDRYVAYVGTYTHGSSVGIHIFDVDAEKGKMIERKVVPINNPSDVIVSTSGKFLYSIADEGTVLPYFTGRRSGTDQFCVDRRHARMLPGSR